jgi:hypothetical protein
VKLYVSAVIDYEVSTQRGRTVSVRRDAAGRALEKKIRDACRYHADECCKEIGRILQLEQQQGKLFDERTKV